MGYILDNCPTLNDCCFSIPLRVGVIIISLLGLIWGGFYVFLFTSPGHSVLEDLGLPSSIGKVIRYIHGLFSVILIAVHIVVFLAAIFESDAFCEVYIWCIFIFWIITILSTIISVWACAANGALLFVFIHITVVVFILLMSFYFTLIVANYRMTLP